MCIEERNIYPYKVLLSRLQSERNHKIIEFWFCAIVWICFHYLTLKCRVLCAQYSWKCWTYFLNICPKPVPLTCSASWFVCLFLEWNVQFTIEKNMHVSNTSYLADNSILWSCSVFSLVVPIDVIETELFPVRMCECHFLWIVSLFFVI